jgi:hypothetical protein
MPPVAEKPVGRKPKGDAQPPPDKKNVKVRADLHRKMAMVAVHRGIDIIDYMEGLLRGPVERDFEQMIREESR